jgi:tetratricopeptide (TPR) repeat protein
MSYEIDSALARPFVFAASQTATSLAIVGKLSRARGLVLRAEPFVGNDPATLGRFLEAKVAIAAHAGELSELVVLTTRARENAKNAGDDRAANVHLINVGFAWMQLGEHERALECFEKARDDAAARGWVSNRRSAAQNAGYVLLQMGRNDEARAVEQAVLDEIGREASPRLLTLTRACLSTIDLRGGNTASALEHAEAAIALATGAPQIAYAETVLAEALLELGDASPALERASRAIAIIAQSGGRHFADARAKLAAARALHALERDDEAQRAIETARDAVLAHAALLPPDRAKTFLERVPANAKTLEFARDWRAPRT